MPAATSGAVSPTVVMSADSESESPSQVPAYNDLSRLIALPMIDAALTEEQVFAACGEAKSLELGSVLVRPTDVDLARNWVEGPLKLACLTGFPGGSSTTPARLYEARDVLRRGVKDLVVTMNLGKLLSRKFLYLESELLQLAENCRQNGARLRVLFEVEQMQQDHVLIGVRLCKRTAVNGIDLLFRSANGEFQLGVARYVLHHAKEKLAVSVHAPEVSLATALAMREAGVSAFVTPSSGQLMQAWRAELERLRKEEELRKKTEREMHSPGPLPSE